MGKDGGRRRKRKRKKGGRFILFMVSEAVVHHGEEGLGHSREVHRTAAKKERGGVGREKERENKERKREKKEREAAAAGFPHLPLLPSRSPPVGWCCPHPGNAPPLSTSPPKTFQTHPEVPLTNLLDAAQSSHLDHPS